MPNRLRPRWTGREVYHESSRTQLKLEVVRSAVVCCAVLCFGVLRCGYCVLSVVLYCVCCVLCCICCKPPEKGRKLIKKPAKNMMKIRIDKYKKLKKHWDSCQNTDSVFGTIWSNFGPPKKSWKTVIFPDALFFTFLLGFVEVFGRRVLFQTPREALFYQRS